tara:strand:+ start:365 stop:1963 length:1599 start_codon:yes stop_codon:yes gene_type:complete
MSDDLTSLLERYNNLPPAEKAEIDKMLLEDAEEVPWRPLINSKEPDQITPQKQAYDSPADVLLFGGAAGGGKSSLMIGLALTAHTKSVIYRREVKQLGPIEEEITRIRKTRHGFNGQLHRFDLGKGRAIRLGGMQYAGDEVAYQGDPRDLICFDELTQFLESQFRYVTTWNRSADASQRCRIVCATNPPTSSEGQWVVDYWAPWLDTEHPNPARPGELRWYISDSEGEDQEVSGPDPVWQDEDWVQPRSRTFIPSSVDDNPFLTNSGYKAALQALPEPLRSQMLMGDFTAGVQDDPWQVIPTEWVERAQERWTVDRPQGAKMDALGVDPARGGKDDFVLTPRYGNWFGEQIVKRGKSTPDGPTGAAICTTYQRNGAPLMLDIIGGAGASIYDHLKTNGSNVVAVDGRAKSHQRDDSGSLGFYNKRSEIWWRMREALNPDSEERIALPPDRDLKVDLCAPRWQLTAGGIQVEGKSTECKDGFGDLKKRLGRSPGKGDSCVYALLEGKRTGGRGSVKPPGRTNSRYNPHRNWRR